MNICVFLQFFIIHSLIPLFNQDTFTVHVGENLYPQLHEIIDIILVVSEKVFFFRFY
jgi:hypothetical protein